MDWQRDTIYLLRHTRTDKSTIGTWTHMGMSLIIDNIEDKDRGLNKTMSLEETKKIKV